MLVIKSSEIIQHFSILQEKYKDQLLHSIRMKYTAGIQLPLLSYLSPISSKIVLHNQIVFYQKNIYD